MSGVALLHLTEFASRRPTRAGIVHWPGGAKITIVIKKTFAVDSRGEATLVEPGSAPSLDETTRDGDVLYPSDFAPFKPRCDCVIAGAEAVNRSGYRVLSCASLVKEAGERAGLGARESFARAGDPSEPSAVRAWGSGRIDFARFQSASPDQRIDYPALPLRIDYRREGLTFATELHAEAPEAAIFDQNGWSAPLLLGLALDTVCIAPAERQVTLLWRSAIDLHERADELSLLAIDRALRAHHASAILDWPRNSLVQPSSLRATVVDLANLDLALDATAFHPAIPERGEGDPFSDKTSSAVRAPRSDVLPFRQGSPGAAMEIPGRQSSDHDWDSKGGTHLARTPHRGGDWDDAGGTRLVIAPVTRPATPFEAGAPASPAEPSSAPAIAAPPWVPAHGTAGPPMPARGVPLTSPGVASSFALPSQHAPSPAMVRPAEPIAQPTFSHSTPASQPALPSSSIGAAPREALSVASAVDQDAQSEARFRAIQQEVWQAKRPLETILKSYGMTELEWRAMKRSFLKKSSG